jgi:hypothetical protein
VYGLEFESVVLEFGRNLRLGSFVETASRVPSFAYTKTARWLEVFRA